MWSGGCRRQQGQHTPQRVEAEETTEKNKKKRARKKAAKAKAKVAAVLAAGTTEVRAVDAVSDENLMGDIVESFVGDTVTKSVEEKDHVNDLAKVLTRLIANNITLKMEKGVWATKELLLLGTVSKHFN